MGRFLALGALALLWTACGSMPPAQTQEGTLVPVVEEEVIKKKILVLHFLNRSPYTNAELTDQVYNDIKSAARHTSDVILMTEEEVAQGGNLTFDGLSYDLKTIYERCRALGISGVVMGAIEDIQVEKQGEESGLFRTSTFQVSAQVRFQLMDVMSEREIAGEVGQGSIQESSTSLFGRRDTDSAELARGTEAVTKALERPLANFSAAVKRLGWVGRIAKIEMHRYYINAGEETGLTKGQLLKVLGDPFPINDTKTGTLIGMAPGRFKGLLRVIDFMGKDGAVATLHSGADIRELDRVEVFTPR